MDFRNNSITRLENIRAQVFDAEELLLFLSDRERLQGLIESTGADVVLGSLIEKAAGLVSYATGETTLLIESMSQEDHHELDSESVHN